jgi:hypothetical protein
MNTKKDNLNRPESGLGKLFAKHFRRRKKFTKMGCTASAVGIWVGFLKQPTLPGKAPPKKNSSNFFYKKQKSLIKITNESKVVQKYHFYFFGALGQAVHQAVSKKRPKSPKLDIPFAKAVFFYTNCHHIWSFI